MNLNVPGANNYSFFPDNENPNLYYQAPNHVEVGSTEEGLPLFSYVEYRVGEVRHATVQTLMVPVHSNEALTTAQDSVRALNPNATFAALPFASSRMTFGNNLRPLVDSASCDHQAGTAFDQQSCVINLNHRGRRSLRALFRSGMSLAVNYEYTVRGVFRTAEGTYENAETVYGISGFIGGPELQAHPELFRDVWGRVLPVTE
jgi:hypothetical protein